MHDRWHIIGFGYCMLEENVGFIYILEMTFLGLSETGYVVNAFDYLEKGFSLLWFLLPYQVFFPTDKTVHSSLVFWLRDVGLVGVWQDKHSCASHIYDGVLSLMLTFFIFCYHIFK